MKRSLLLFLAALWCVSCGVLISGVESTIFDADDIDHTTEVQHTLHTHHLVSSSEDLYSIMRCSLAGKISCSPLTDSGGEPWLLVSEEAVELADLAASEELVARLGDLQHVHHAEALNHSLRLSSVAAAPMFPGTIASVRELSRALARLGSRWLTLPVVVGASVSYLAFRLVPSDGGSSYRFQDGGLRQADSSHQVDQKTRSPHQRPREFPPLITEPQPQDRSDQPAPIQRVMECLNVVYPLAPGYSPPGGQRHRPPSPFVPRLPVPSDLSGVYECLDVLDSLTDPVLRGLVEYKAAFIKDPQSPYQMWLKGDDGLQASSPPRLGSGSAHQQSEAISYFELARMLAKLQWHQVVESGYFASREEFEAENSKAKRFVEHIEFERQKVQMPVYYSALDSYWYRVVLIDHLAKQARQAKQITGQISSPSTEIREMEIVRVLRYLKSLSSAPLAKDLKDRVLSQEPEMKYAHPKHALNPRIKKAQVTEILEQMIHLLALQVGRDPAALREELIRLDTSLPSSAPLSAEEESEIREMIAQGYRKSLELPMRWHELNRFLSEFESVRLASQRQISAIDVAGLMSQNLRESAREEGHRTLDRAFTDISLQILNEFNHGQRLSQVYQHLTRTVHDARRTQELYAPITLEDRVKSLPFRDQHRQETLDELHSRLLQNHQLRQELVAKLTEVRKEFVALARGVSASRLSLSELRGIDLHPTIVALKDAPIAEGINPDFVSQVLMDMQTELWARYDTHWLRSIGRSVAEAVHKTKYWSVIARLEKLRFKTVPRLRSYHSIGKEILNMRLLLRAIHLDRDSVEDLSCENQFEICKSQHLSRLIHHDSYQMPPKEDLMAALDELTQQMQKTRRMSSVALFRFF